MKQLVYESHVTGFRLLCLLRARKVDYPAPPASTNVLRAPPPCTCVPRPHSYQVISRGNYPALPRTVPLLSCLPNVESITLVSIN